MNLRDRMRARIPRNTSGRWYQIRNLDEDRVVVRIYDEIGFFGVSAEDFASEIARLDVGEIEVQINSPGGDVFDGIAIYNAIRTHPARVTTRVDGVAASAASVIAQAGDHRVMLQSSQMMIHEAWGLAIGPADEMREFADLLDQQNDIIAGIYATRSGGEIDEFRSLMSAETWMTDQEAVDRGLADELVVPALQNVALIPTAKITEPAPVPDPEPPTDPEPNPDPVTFDPTPLLALAEVRDTFGARAE
ncbi:MAG: Clp protease ClpP [Acidimicrobiia bacterium]|nr:Clp protease ClpP [Acidimicrobiia bacterium]